MTPKFDTPEEIKRCLKIMRENKLYSFVFHLTIVYQMQPEHSAQFETFTNQYISHSFAASLAFGLEQDCKNYVVDINVRILIFYD